MSIFKKTFSIFLSLTIMLSVLSFTSIFAEDDGGYPTVTPIEASLEWIYFVKTTDGTEPEGIDLNGTYLNGTYGDYSYGKVFHTIYGEPSKPGEPCKMPDLSPELYIDDINASARSLYDVENVEEVRVWYGYWFAFNEVYAYAHFFDGSPIDIGNHIFSNTIRNYPEGLPFEDTVLIEKDFETLRYGSVCNEETVGISDVILLSKHVYGKLTLDPDSQEYKNANCDLRSDAVDASDLKALIDFLIGKVEALPVR